MLRRTTLVRSALAVAVAAPLLGACAVGGPTVPPFIYLDTPAKLLLVPTAVGGPQVGVATVRLENHTDEPLSGPLTASGTTNRSGWTVSVDPASPCFALTGPGTSLADEAICDLWVTVTAPAGPFKPNANLGSADVEVTWGGHEASDAFDLEASV